MTCSDCQCELQYPFVICDVCDAKFCKFCSIWRTEDACCGVLVCKRHMRCGACGARCREHGPETRLCSICKAVYCCKQCSGTGSVCVACDPPKVVCKVCNLHSWEIPEEILCEWCLRKTACANCARVCSQCGLVECRQCFSSQSPHYCRVCYKLARSTASASIANNDRKKNDIATEECS